MPSIDMSLEQMRHIASLYREADFESFWDQTITAAINQPSNAELIPYNLSARGLECFAVRFDGFEGEELPGGICGRSGRESSGIVCLPRYSGRGTRPLDLVEYASQGVCVLSMDCRGQNGQSQESRRGAGGHYSGG